MKLSFKTKILTLLITLSTIFLPQTIQASSLSNFNIVVTPAPQCYDGIDNDSDGFIDYPLDPGCDSYTDDSESSTTGGGGSSGGGGGSKKINPEADIVFSGKAQPNSTVKVLVDGSFAYEAQADLDANFEISLDNYTPGIYNFTFVSVDLDGIPSAPYSFPLVVTKGSLSEVTGIHVSPTIDSNKIKVRHKDTLTIFGQTIPNSLIVIEVSSENSIISTTVSDNEGRYVFQIDTTPLEYGQHSVQIRTEANYDGSEITTAYSQTLFFEVGDENIFKTPGAVSCKADLNFDQKVNIVDFSIAAFWYNRSLPLEISPIESTCLNGDGIINLVDFSIMAFYWTG